MTLTSEKNPALKDVRRAASRGELTSEGCVVAEGMHLLVEAIHSHVEITTVILAESAHREAQHFSDEIGEARILYVADQAFRAIASTENPQGVITLVRPPVWTFEDLIRGTALLVILDAIQDPGNAGTMVRTAEAFGATGVVFLKGTVSPHNPKCLRASAGSLFRLPVVTGMTDHDLLNQLDWNGVRLYTAQPGGEEVVAEASFTGRCAIAVGNEGQGVRMSLATSSRSVRIPTAGVESLNAAMAAGVMLYEACRQRTRE